MAGSVSNTIFMKNVKHVKTYKYIPNTLFICIRLSHLWKRK